MDTDENLIGCFVSGPSVNWNDDQNTKKSAKEMGELFRDYIWGKQGISDILKKLQYPDYGTDFIIILFQFYLNPIQYELANLKEIENYRKKEKSIGIPIVVTTLNFFSRTESERRIFLKNSILDKLILLESVVHKNKLNLNIEKLRMDLGSILKEY